MTDALQCWKCGRPLEDFPLPIARADECPACHADLHACRLCRFYDTSAAHACREPIADEVKDKERANFCGYFMPRSGAYRPATGAAVQAEAGLAALFGTATSVAARNPAAATDEARSALDALFKSGK